MCLGNRDLDLDKMENRGRKNVRDKDDSNDVL